MTQFMVPTTIIEGVGSSSQLPSLCTSQHVVVVTDSGLSQAPILHQIIDLFIQNTKVPHLYSAIEPNPDQIMVEQLSAYLQTCQKESSEPIWVVAVGGGSAIDTAKAAVCLAVNEGDLSEYLWEGKEFLNPPMPLIAVPTTAGTGSEVTGVTVIASRNTKKGIKQKAIFPCYALIDPLLMVSLPPSLTASTGMDALTHAIEAYVGKNRNPLVRALAQRAITLLVSSIERAYTDGNDIGAREAMAHGSLLAGIAMDQGGLGIVHSLSSALCGILHVAHGEGNALLLPYGMRYNIPYATQELAEIANLFGIQTQDISLQEAAEAGVLYIEQLLCNIGLSLAIENIRKKLQFQQDFNEFGQIAASMFLMNNNPHKASAKECIQIFSHISTQ